MILESMSTFFDEIIQVEAEKSKDPIVFGVKAATSTSSNLYKLDIQKKEFTEYRKAIGSLLDYNKLSTDPFGKYLAIQTSKTSFFIVGDLETEGRDIGGNIRVEKYAIDYITGIRFYGPYNFVVVGVNGIMVGYEITGGFETKSGKIGSRTIKFSWKRDVDLNRDEIIDTYDVLATGEIIAFTTRFKKSSTAYRLLI